MPALMTYQLVDSAYPVEPTTDRGEIEQLALACLHFGTVGSLDATVIETRYNVVRSNVPHTVAAIRMLRDYLPAAEAARLSADAQPGVTWREDAVGAELVIGP
jgi:hypothetical protein